MRPTPQHVLENSEVPTKGAMLMKTYHRTRIRIRRIRGKYGENISRRVQTHGVSHLACPGLTLLIFFPGTCVRFRSDSVGLASVSVPILYSTSYEWTLRSIPLKI
jgi:hypothetical protein